MRRIWCVSLLLLCGLFLITRQSEAQSGVRVDEAATRVLLHSDHAEIVLVVKSSLARPVPVKIKLDLINELNRSIAGDGHRY